MDPRPELLHDWFLRSARSHEDRIAVEVPASGDRPAVRIRYAELRERSGRLAARLQPLVRPDDLVAVFLPRENGALYLGQLGVLQAGAAYLSLVDQLPDERIRFLLEDSGARVVVTDARRSERVHRIAPDLELLILDDVLAGPESAARLEPAGVTGRNLAYVIYTSGTTGEPKGVQIEHRSICNLVGSDVDHFGLDESTRSVQTSSPVFDSSLEEIWLAWSVGGTVLVADDEVARLGPDLIPWLRSNRATVFCPTPTLLRAIGCRNPSRDLPHLRLVYVGGEAVPESLLEVWGRATGPRFENGYGPTECTVTVTRATLRRGEPVTIGRPVGGHDAFVLDRDGGEHADEVPDGETGELCFRGPGLARGYLGRPELTRARFPDHPRLGRIYRTGDLGRRLPNGSLVCLGRVDAQVKLRGYRIELTEIEARMQAIEGVREAACRLQSVSGEQQLVGFVTLDGTAQVEPGEVRSRLARELPPYMVPVACAVLDRVPTTLSGKIDRDSLPEIDVAVASGGASHDRPGRPAGTDLERKLGLAVAPLLGTTVERLDCERDFFELGGDSVRAAEWVSILRDDEATRAVSVRDVYRFRTVAALAAHLGSRAPETAGSSAGEPSVPQPIRSIDRVLFGLAQVVFLVLALLAASATSWFLISAIVPWFVRDLSVVALLLLSPLLLQTLRILLVPFGIGLALLVKRCVMPRYRAGRYRAYSIWHLRHWIVQRSVTWIPFGVTAGTVFQSVWLRLLGARIGSRVHLHRGAQVFRSAFDLLEIDDDAVIGQDANLATVELVDHWFVVAPIRVGARSLVAVRSNVEGGASIGSDCELRPSSSLRSGSRMADGEIWDGVPAEPVGRTRSRPTARDDEARRNPHPFRHGLVQLVLEDLCRAVLGLPAMAVTLLILQLLGLLEARAFLAFMFDPLAHGGAVAWLGAGVVLSGPLSLFVSGLAMRIVAPVPAGAFARFGRRYWSIWIRTGVLDRAGEILSGTMFWPWWLRLSGMRLGTNSEVSTITDVLPEQCSIGRDSFFADGIYFGGPILRDGVVEVGPVSVGSRSFLGNHAVVEPSTTIPDDVLVGVCTVAGAAPLRPGSSWFGHPPFELPKREVVEADRSVTHEPSTFLYWNRFAWEASRFLLPVLVGLLGLVWIDLVEDRSAEHGREVIGADAAPVGSSKSITFWLLELPALSILSGLAAVLVVLATKWILLGRVRPGQHGLWSTWCCRWDFVYVLWARLARGPLSMLDGTPMLHSFLRLFGVSIGRSVTLGRGFAHIVDPDMLHFEDGACVDGLFQAHTFEDRVLKIGKVFIRRGASTRHGSVLMYGADLGEGCRVEPHTVVMKNERLEPGRVHEGVPSHPRARR